MQNFKNCFTLNMSRKNSVLSAVCFKYTNNTLCSFVALMRRATVHNQLQNYQTAIEDLNKVLCIEPENAIAKVKTNEFNKT